MEEKEKTIIKILKAPIRFILPYNLRLWIYILTDPSRKVRYWWDRVTICSRENIANFMADVLKQNIVKNPIVEIGTGPYEFNKDLFSKRYKFIATDMRYYGSIIDTVCYGENLPFLSSSVGTVICSEVLEHVPKFIKVIEEIYRVLMDGGVLVLTTPFGYHFHDNPNDYWRFTTYGLKYILNPYFKDIDIKMYSYIKDDEFPLNICLTARKK
jgi:SAM-dependent methyltransferase